MPSEKIRRSNWPYRPDPECRTGENRSSNGHRGESPKTNGENRQCEAKFLPTPTKIANLLIHSGFKVPLAPFCQICDLPRRIGQLQQSDCLRQAGKSRELIKPSRFTRVRQIPGSQGRSADLGSSSTTNPLLVRLFPLNENDRDHRSRRQNENQRI